MYNLKAIYVDAEGQPVITHYNSSWHVIKQETTDNLDYSICIYETISEGIYQAEQSLGYELEGDEYKEEVAYILENMADAYCFELVQETEN